MNRISILRQKAKETGETSGAAVADSSSAQADPIVGGTGATKPVPRPLTRDQAIEAMVAIDDLRVRLVKEIKQHRRAEAKAADLTTGIELRRRETQLGKLLVLHQAIGEAFDAGGY